MTDTLFEDRSEFNPFFDTTYPYKFASLRSNDGTYQDHHFAANLAWCKASVANGRLTGFMVYYVFEPGTDSVGVLERGMGAPHPKMAIMIDVESWQGRIAGDHSAAINAERERLIKWLGGNRRRVIGYANGGDFANIWPHRGDCTVVLANYSSNPNFPGKIAHQFSDHHDGVAIDINSADGYSPAQFAIALGLTAPIPTPKPVVKPATPIAKPSAFKVMPLVAGSKQVSAVMVQTETKDWPAGKWPGVFMLENQQLKHIHHTSDVNAYHIAGIPGVITISKDEFLSYPIVGK